LKKIPLSSLLDTVILYSRNSIRNYIFSDNEANIGSRRLYTCVITQFENCGYSMFLPVFPTPSAPLHSSPQPTSVIPADRKSMALLAPRDLDGVGRGFSYVLIKIPSSAEGMPLAKHEGITAETK
jgi:hypothetical protein